MIEKNNASINDPTADGKRMLMFDRPRSFKEDLF
jgi:hypothetical protein